MKNNIVYEKVYKNLCKDYNTALKYIGYNIENKTNVVNLNQFSSFVIDRDDSSNIISRHGDVILDIYLKIKTINNDYPIGIKSIDIYFSGKKYISSPNIRIISKNDCYLIGISDINIIIPLLKIQHNEIKVEYSLETTNNIEKFIGLKSTYVLLKNHYRKIIIQTPWKIFDNEELDYFFCNNSEKKYDFLKFFYEIITISSENELITDDIK